MFARTAVAVTAGANFVVETAIYFVLFGAEDGCEVAWRKRILAVRILEARGGTKLTWPCCDMYCDLKNEDQ